MKNMKMKLVVLCLLAAMLLVGCGGSGGFAGTWKVTEISASGLTMKPAEMGMEMVFELKSDGSATISVNGETETGLSWKETSNGVEISGDGQAIEFKKNGSKLEAEAPAGMGIGDAKLVLEKQ